MNEQKNSKDNIKNNEINDNINQQNENKIYENKNLIKSNSNSSNFEELNKSENENMNLDENQNINDKTNQDNTIDNIDNYYLENTNSKFTIKERNLFSDPNLENIQKEIQEITKKIFNEKIKLRICTERYEQKYKTYSKFQGKVPEVTKEEKEKEILERIKKKKKTNISET